MIKLMFITNNEEVAHYAYNSGVQRIFVDLEVLGKVERQGHLDTVISHHQVEDVGRIRKRVPDVDLLVRINPVNPNTSKEIEQVIEQGADFIMLPMFTRAEEVEEVARLIDGRAKLIPLIETLGAVDNIDELVKIKGVHSYHIGLNDMHLESSLHFMFELLINGTVTRLIDAFTKAGIEFGIGGVAKMEEGHINGATVLAEYVRLNSSAVILSRSFHKGSNANEELAIAANLKESIEKLRAAEQKFKLRSTIQVAKDEAKFRSEVEQVVKRIQEREKTI